MIIQHLLNEATRKLTSITDCPRLEAEVLLAEALNKPRSYLFAHPDETVNEGSERGFAQFLERRLQQEPIAYILGRREFYGRSFFVNEATLIPRPETELLVSIVLETFPDQKNVIQLADLGTGSGAIALALALERPIWKISATDVSESALELARKNAHTLGVNNVSFYQGSWCTPLPIKTFDVIVSNPPYLSEGEWEIYRTGLSYEPKTAFVADKNGLADIETIAHMARDYLKPDGHLILEHGYSQASDVQTILADLGYTAVVTLKDIAGKDRVTCGRYHLNKAD